MVVTEKGKEASDLTNIKVDNTDPSTPVFSKVVEGARKLQLLYRMMSKREIKLEFLFSEIKKLL